MSAPPPLPVPPPLYRTAPRPGRRLVFLAGAAVGVVGVGGMLIVGLLGAVVVFGGRLLEEQVQADLKDNAVIAEYLGDVRRFDIEWIASGMHPDNETFVFQVDGSKGSGLLVAKCITVDADHEDVTEGTLKVAGRTYDLFPAGP